MGAICSLLVTGCGIYPEPTVGDARLLGQNLVTFDAIQADILTPACARPTCHGAPRGAPMSLEEGAAYANLVSVQSRQAPALLRIHPSSPGTSYLVHKIRGTAHEVDGRPTRMPLNRTPLSEDAIRRIEAWIRAGAPEIGTQGSASPSDSDD